MKLYLAGPLFTPYERAFLAQQAQVLRAHGFEVFVPHEQTEQLRRAGIELTPSAIFAKDIQGITSANAIVALLDGPMVDDGTACEIGIFYGLKQHDPSKKGVLGLLTDFRVLPSSGRALNKFLHGCIQQMGAVYNTIEEVIEHLDVWRRELERAS